MIYKCFKNTRGLNKVMDENTQKVENEECSDNLSLSGDVSWDTLKTLEDTEDVDDGVYDIDTEILDKEVERLEVLYNDIIKDRSNQEDIQIKLETLLNDARKTVDTTTRVFKRAKEIEEERKIEQEALLESIKEQQRIKDNMNLTFITLDRTLKAIRNTKDGLDKQLRDIMDRWKNLSERESRVSEMELELVSKVECRGDDGNLRKIASSLREREKALTERETQMKLREEEILGYCEHIQECLEYFRHIRESME